MSDTTLSERLRAGAQGSLPEKAAVEFLLAAGAPWDSAVLYDTPEHGIAILNFPDGYTPPGWMSGGERRMWKLIYSLVEGELNDAFWGIDEQRQDAFLRALRGNR